jgi:hypothetical protein
MSIGKSPRARNYNGEKLSQLSIKLVSKNEINFKFPLRDNIEINYNNFYITMNK